MEATVLFVDLAGFTALTEAHGDEGAADLALRFHDLARLALHRDARLVKTIGDAVMIVGARPLDVVEIARRLIRAVTAETGFPAIRAGIHTGPVVERAGDIFGATVNLAARIAAYARADQVLCSAAVVAALAGSPLRARPLAAVQFKNVSGSVELFELDVADGPRSSSGAIDPVCRMRVDLETAPAKLPFAGRTYGFCSLACARAFAQAPETYAGT
jgi:class 3 adenylate cyclase/YHS domain-containing protein